MKTEDCWGVVPSTSNSSTSAKVFSDPKNLAEARLRRLCSLARPSQTMHTKAPFQAFCEIFRKNLPLLMIRFTALSVTASFKGHPSLGWPFLCSRFVQKFALEGNPVSRYRPTTDLAPLQTVSLHNTVQDHFNPPIEPFLRNGVSGKQLLFQTVNERETNRI